MSALAVAAAAFLLVAVIIHLAIFAMESVLWPRPAVWRRFGLREQRDADVVRPMAFNQGFYNLFLAVGAGLGLVLLGSPPTAQAGAALAFFAGASMVSAALVLVTSSPKLARAAAVQGAAPLLGIAMLAASLVLG